MSCFDCLKAGLCLNKAFLQSFVFIPVRQLSLGKEHRASELVQTATDYHNQVTIPELLLCMKG